jgi:hypothetical protein
MAQNAAPPVQPQTDNALATQQPQIDALANEQVPMIFNDGSKGLVARAHVLDAIKDGGTVGHYMQFDDGSKDIIPHENLQGAMGDGGKVLDPSALRQQAEAANASRDPTLGDYGSIIGRAALTMAGEVGAGRIATPAIQKVTSAAEDLPAPSLKALFKIGMDTAKESEVAGGNISSAGAQKFMDVAYKGAAQARAAGNTSKALAYDAAAMAGKTYKAYSDVSTWVDKTIPGAPFALKLWAVAHLAKEGIQKVDDLAFGSDDEDTK